MPPNVELATTLVAPVSNDIGSVTHKTKDEDEVFNWEQVYYFVSTNQIKSLHRHKQVQVVYDKWRKDTLAQYGSLENYLLTNKLEFGTMKDAQRPPVIILPNDFPYSVEADIDHILLWSQVPLSRTYIEDILENNYGSDKYEWVYWVNPPEIQSVKKLPHVHVFMHPKQSS
ncbi:hypothetical protein BDF20DRAFT_884403 [Mycotypha africana]|uniref:uncharacterized protein n=1 Tax=Mycotypha africana TaxID=64632 RepID=UPI00230019C0|nr:uncharacterized protein BDF20DRAFT_884403 [Mycotypha africana]KAI8971414.1 hypothetical protein BDF20DRAFT_884403 [Mycotypha africana]